VSDLKLRKRDIGNGPGAEKGLKSLCHAYIMAVRNIGKRSVFNGLDRVFGLIWLCGYMGAG
jgi:hypothetical protein